MTKTDSRREQLRRMVSLPVLERWLAHSKIRRYGFGALLLSAAIAVGAFLVGSVALELEARSIAKHGLPAVPSASRLFVAPATLEIGQEYEPETLIGNLQDLGYRKIEREDSGSSSGPRPGSFTVLDEKVTTQTANAAEGESLVFTRRSVGTRARSVVRIGFRNGSISQLAVEGKAVGMVDLDRLEVELFDGGSQHDHRPLGTVPEHVRLAILAAEDESFLEHPGVSIVGIARAALVNLRKGEIRQGGSTLTQQLARNVFLHQRRTLKRKLREALTALALERAYDKRRLLDEYLDRAYWGARDGVQIVGIEAAAWRWFGVPAIDLSVAEAATLAGVLSAPGRYAPGRVDERTRERRDRVLDRMHDLGWLDGRSWKGAKLEPLQARSAMAPSRGHEHWARRAWAEVLVRTDMSEGDLATGGYLVYGALDLQAQSIARNAAEDRLEKVRGSDGLEVALISLDPTTGLVDTYVGGRDWRASRFDRVAQSRRPVGSLFKPFVFATAIEEGTFHPKSVVLDAPIAIRFGEEDWRPKNSNDEYSGWISLETALAKSLNTATVRVAAATGLEAIAQAAVEFGLTRERPVGPSMVLGAIDSSPLQVASAYASLANGGARVEPVLVAEVIDSSGRSVALSHARAQETISPETAWMVTEMLQGVIDRGTGWEVRRSLKGALAGKTGTSNDSRDSWFAGFSAGRVTVVWVGKDNNQSTGLTGARGALPIWTRYMTHVRPKSGYELSARPETLERVRLDPWRATLISGDCPWTVVGWVVTARHRKGTCQIPPAMFALDFTPGLESKRPEIETIVISRALSRPEVAGRPAADLRLGGEREADVSFAGSSPGVEVLELSASVLERRRWRGADRTSRKRTSGGNPEHVSSC